MFNAHTKYSTRLSTLLSGAQTRPTRCERWLRTPLPPPSASSTGGVNEQKHTPFEFSHSPLTHRHIHTRTPHASALRLNGRRTGHGRLSNVVTKRRGTPAGRHCRRFPCARLPCPATTPLLPRMPEGKPAGPRIAIDRAGSVLCGKLGARSTRTGPHCPLTMLSA